MLGIFDIFKYIFFSNRTVSDDNIVYSQTGTSSVLPDKIFYFKINLINYETQVNWGSIDDYTYKFETTNGKISELTKEVEDLKLYYFNGTRQFLRAGFYHDSTILLLRYDELICIEKFILNLGVHYSEIYIE